MPQAQFIHSLVLDRGLAYVAAATTRLILTPTLPTDYAAALAAALGEALTLLTGPQNAENGGREVVSAAIDNGVVIQDGTAGFWGWLADDAQLLLVATELQTPRDLLVTQGFTMTPLTFRFPSGIMVPEVNPLTEKPA